MRRMFVLVSFEGPDWYAWRGDLAARAVGLATELVTCGWETHHVFLGDPWSPGSERLAGGLLTLHRWAQWLSAGLPSGVYHGEEAKQIELARTLPGFAVEQLIGPALASGQVPTIIAEEWQTAGFVVRLAELLRRDGLDRDVRVVWRVGSRFGWERVDWPALACAATVAATRPELRQELHAHGIEAVVLPADPAATLAALFGRERRSVPPATMRPLKGLGRMRA